MEKEGNNTEQTQAPTSGVGPDDSTTNVSDKAPTAETTTTPDTNSASESPVFQPVGQEPAQPATQPTTDQAPAPQPSTQPTDQSPVVNTPAPATTDKSAKPLKNKRLLIIAGIAAATILLCTGIVILVVNIVNNNGANTNGAIEVISNENLEQTTQGEEVKAQADQLAADSDIRGMIDYIDGVIKEYNDGTNYQDLTKGDIGILCAKGIENIYDFISDNNDQMYAFVGAIFRYAYTEESMVATADSAVDIFFAESLYGNPNTAEEYKQIAISRGSTIWEINGEKEE